MRFDQWDNSKLDAQGEFDESRYIALHRHAAESGVDGIDVRAAELGVVGDVERVGRKNDLGALPNIERLLNAKVPVTRIVDGQRSESFGESSDLVSSRLVGCTSVKADEAIRNRAGALVGDARIKPL